MTLGCRTNQAESSIIEGNLSAMGWQVVDINDKPDYCIINTCSVTAKSDYQSRQLIRKAYRAGAKVVVTGCYSELNEPAVRTMPGVSRVVSNDRKLHIIEQLTGKREDTTLGVALQGRARFHLKVQDGCNFTCSYCLITRARGRSQSLPVHQVLREAESAAERYGEVVLTGIHLGSYGYDLSPQVLLPDLVKRLLEVGVKRLRLSSLEIREVTDDLIEAMEDQRICDHLHIPLQSGSDKVLRRMNRGYTAKAYRTGFERIISRYPDISIGTDIITGFPGETDDEFQETYNLIRDLPLSYLHVFPFSSRPGTSAASMPDHVDHVTKKARASRLIALSSEKKTQFMTKQIGRTLELLLEERLDEGLYRGTTVNFLKARAVFTTADLRSLAAVRVAGIERGELIAVPI